MQIQIEPLSSPRVQAAIAADAERRAAPGTFPHVYDNSMLSQARNCPRLFLYRTFLNLAPKTKQHPLSFGSAIHASLETFYRRCFDAWPAIEKARSHDGASVEEIYRLKNAMIYEPSRQAFIVEARKDPTLPLTIDNELPYKPHSLERGISLMQAYFEQCPVSKHGETFWVIESPEDVECGFAVIVGDIIFIGKADLVVRLRGMGKHYDGKLAVVDHKTTTRMNEHWNDQWRISHQLTGYLRSISAIKGEEARTAIVNALYFNKNIEKVDLHVITTRSDEDIRQWEMEVINLVSELEWKYEQFLEAAKLPAEMQRMNVETARSVLTEESAYGALSTEAVSIFVKNDGHCFTYRKPCAMHRICCAKDVHQRVATVRSKGYELNQWMPYKELLERGTGVT